MQIKLTVCSYDVTYVFQSESTLCSCLNVMELLVRNSRDIWRLSDCNGTWTHNHLVHIWTLNHLAKLAIRFCTWGQIWSWLSKDMQKVSQSWHLQYLVQIKLIVCSYHVTYTFQGESTLFSFLSLVAWMSRNSLLETGAISEN